MTTTKSIDGKIYLRALLYVLEGVPVDDDKAALQHVTFFGNRMVVSDGYVRLDAHLPAEVEEPFSVARLSMSLLKIGLEYAHKFSKAASVAFMVKHVGNEVIIEYGAKHPLIHPLEILDMKGYPPDLQEWVPMDAPLNAGGLGHLSCDQYVKALSWWRSWNKDKGTFEVRGGLDGGPSRVDITEGGARVATAFIMPVDHPGAELRAQPTLFDKKRPWYGRSVLALDISGDGEAAPEPVIIKIGETEINVTGIDAEGLPKAGPCKHRETEDACLPCSLDEVDARKRLKKAELESVEGAAPRRRGRKKPAEETTPLASEPDAATTH